MIRIANAAGFWGDSVAAPLRTVRASALDFLTLEYLAELTMSILARQREKDPTAGYATDFLRVLASLAEELAGQPQLHIVTNAGGMNPAGCAGAAARILCQAGLEATPLAVVDGDDLLPHLDRILAATPLPHLDTGELLGALRQRVVAANAYLGAVPIAEGLAQQARIVITGRVADASLTVGPAVARFGWKWDDYDRLAAASVAGHLIECGAQSTGGFYTHWQEIDLADVGYPVAELQADGHITLTKPDGTAGVVNRETVCEQLVYEIGDPACYRTPDVDVDFRQVEVEETTPNRVQVRGARGVQPSEYYKVSLAYRDGYLASSQMLVYGRDCLAKADACADIVFRQLAAEGITFTDALVEKLGAGSAVPGVDQAPEGLREVVLRITVRHESKAAVERFAEMLVPLATSGPAGLAGYAALRPVVRPVFSYWPTLVPKDLLNPRVQVKPAKDWAGS
jgi:hypothetical protein